MNMQKISNFLKELRKEKNLTQEQLAEVMNVSRRTVSRWETGSSMPDLDVLMELADYYEVELRELLDGERKSEQMNKELEETVRKVADYSNEEKDRVMKRMHWLFIVTALFMACMFCLVLVVDEMTPLYDFLYGMANGMCFGMVIVGIIITGKHVQKIRAWKLGMLRRMTGKDGIN